MSFFADLHSDDARLGGKARSLARLSAAGLRTPAGFAVTHELFRAIGPVRSLPERIDDAALAELDRARADLMAAPFPAGFPEELARRLAQHARLTAAESDRAVRLAQVYANAAETLGDGDKAAAWLKTPNRALRGGRPLDQLDTDPGVREVEDVLGRIAYGVYS